MTDQATSAREEPPIVRTEENVFVTAMVVARGCGAVRLGQTSAIHFGSHVLASIAGFVATLYIARELGSSTLGTYSVFVAVLIWLKTAIGTGLHEAVKKRISEAGERSGDLGAGILLQAVGFLVVAAAAVTFSGPLNDYLGFEGTVALVGTFALVLTFAFVRTVLEGERKVHLSALLWPLDRIVRSGVQLGVVFLGLLGGGLVGLVWGYAAGAAVATLVGLVGVGGRPGLPRREHFERVLGFARYSWLSGVEERSFSSMDTVVLGVFVAPNLIGYYEVSWNLASILAIFGVSISDAMFPTISKLDSEDERAAVGGLVNDALAFTGLFLVPGLVGAVVVGERVLAIYGPGFRQAGTVLLILIVARLLYAYEAQLVSTLNAIDRPEIAFRVNAVFVGLTLGLNVVLVYLYGWVGAAVATTLAAAVGLVLAYRALRGIVHFDVPVSELTRQWIAAAGMGVVVYVAEPALSRAFTPAVYGTVLLVGVGAGVYLAILVSLSKRFRTTLRDNVSV